MPERTEPPLAVLLSVILGFEYRIDKDARGDAKIHSSLSDVPETLSFVPLKSAHRKNVQKNLHVHNLPFAASCREQAGGAGA